MAKFPSPRLYFTIFFLLFLFLVISTDIPGVEAKLCQRRSRTWSGFCAISNNCNRQCRNWEGAQHGACHAQFPGAACFCYFNC